jgi:hypothetical protein
MKRTWKPTVTVHNSIVNEVFIGANYLPIRTAEKMRHMRVLYLKCPLHVGLQFKIMCYK